MRVAKWSDIRIGAVVRSSQGYEYRVVAGPDVINGLHCVRATSPGCVGAFYIWKEGVDEGRYTLITEGQQ